MISHYCFMVILTTKSLKMTLIVRGRISNKYFMYRWFYFIYFFLNNSSDRRNHQILSRSQFQKKKKKKILTLYHWHQNVKWCTSETYILLIAMFCVLQAHLYIPRFSLMNSFESMVKVTVCIPTGQRYEKFVCR